MTIGQFLVTFTTFIGINFLFQKFYDIEGFTYYQVLLCYSLILTSFSITEVFTKGFNNFSYKIKTGQFDRILLRPQNSVFQIFCNEVELSKIGQLLQGIYILIVSLINNKIIWNAYKILTLLFMIIGGIILFLSIFIFQAALCFFTIENFEFMNILTNGAKEYCKYPLVIYGKISLKFCTFIIPYALIQYYPLLYILGEKNEIHYVILPLMPIIFLLITVLFWNVGVKNYKSTGS